MDTITVPIASTRLTPGKFHIVAESSSYIRVVIGGDIGRHNMRHETSVCSLLRACGTVCKFQNEALKLSRLGDLPRTASRTFLRCFAGTPLECPSQHAVFWSVLRIEAKPQKYVHYRPACHWSMEEALRLGRMSCKSLTEARSTAANRVSISATLPRVKTSYRLAGRWR